MGWASSTPEPLEKAAIDVPKGGRFPPKKKGEREQFDAAIAAAMLLAPFVGHDEDCVVVSVAGHSNPGHRFDAAEPDESITVTIQARPVERYPDLQTETIEPTPAEE